MCVFESSTLSPDGLEYQWGFFATIPLQFESLLSSSNSQSVGGVAERVSGKVSVPRARLTFVVNPALDILKSRLPSFAE